MSEIAQLCYGNKFDKNKMSHNNPSVNFVSRTEKNNGVSDYVDKIEGVEPYPAGAITLAFGGSIGSCFLQETPFYTGQNVGVILFSDNVSSGAKLWFTTALSKVCKSKFTTFSDEINKHFKTDLSVFLPATIKEVPDWDYMQEYITKLEQEYIVEIERKRDVELEKYLVATGLNDYKLADEDIKILDAVPEMQNFRVDNLFEKQNLGWISNRKFDKNRDVSQIKTDEFSLPLVNAKNGNNGIMYYGRESDFAFVKGGLDIVSDGAVSTGNVYPQPHKIGVLYNAYIVILKNDLIERKIFEYLACSMQKAIKYQFGYDNKATWERVRAVLISLPIKIDDANQPIIDNDLKYHPDGFIPDWDYMDAYIRAIEKLVIKDVVDFKDAFIAGMKSVVKFGHDKN